ncbi:MAG TPA: DUF3043 domain-containing protein, partial [Mycobacteriales bacterium]|nr:DUF3043 domain-containing protein [Mycobacteriales bacterium]
MILGRRLTPPDPAPDETEPAPTGKGRPTPKRSEARKRRRTPAPKTRKEAAAQQRERNRDVRRKQREALLTGDERNLPPRDAGPEKRLARDFVDSRFTLGQIFFALILVTLVLTFIPVAAAVGSPLALLFLIVIFGDAIRNGRKARDAVTAKYGAGA